MVPKPGNDILRRIDCGTLLNSVDSAKRTLGVDGWMDDWLAGQPPGIDVAELLFHLCEKFSSRRHFDICLARDPTQGAARVADILSRIWSATGCVGSNGPTVLSRY